MLCETCNKNEAQEPHPCPFQQEIYGDNTEDFCTCCKDCEQDCADDI